MNGVTDIPVLYTGIRINGTRWGKGICSVYGSDGTPLSPAMDVGRHSNSFDWGVGRAAPITNLAKSILDNFLEADTPKSVWFYFRNDVINGLPSDMWELRESDLLEWLNNYYEKFCL